MGGFESSDATGFLEKEGRVRGRRSEKVDRQAHNDGAYAVASAGERYRRQKPVRQGSQLSAITQTETPSVPKDTESPNFAFNPISPDSIAYIKSIPNSSTFKGNIYREDVEEACAKAFREAGFSVALHKESSGTLSLVVTGKTLEGKIESEKFTGFEIIEYARDLVEAQTGEKVVPPVQAIKGPRSSKKNRVTPQKQAKKATEPNLGVEKNRSVTMEQFYAVEQEAQRQKGYINRLYNTKEHVLPEIEHVFLESFDIPGVEKLSEGQKKSIIENLKEYRIPGKEFIRDVWEGIIPRIKASYNNANTAGENIYERTRIICEILVQNSLAFGPKFHTENDEALPDLVNIELSRESRKEQYEASRNLNVIAHRFAKIPESWQEDGIGTHATNKFTSFLKDTLSKIPFVHGKRKQYNEYQLVQNSYVKAKNELARVLRESGKSEGEIAKILIETDGKVHSLRFIQTAPEEVSTVQNISDTGMWRKIGKSLFDKENIGYMTFGLLARAATAEFLNLAAGPTVATLVGGMRGWNKAAAELRERDRSARMGGKDDSDEALNIAQAVHVIEIGGHMRDRGIIQRTKDLIESFYDLQTKITFASDRMDTDAIIHFQEKSDRVLEQLSARAIFMEDKQKLNRINFGTNSEHAANLTNFFEVLAEAKMIVAEHDGKAKSGIEIELERYLVNKEHIIQKKRRLFQIKKLAQGALKSGVFSFAGASIAEYIRISAVVEKAQELVVDTPKVKSSIESSSTVESQTRTVPQAEIREVDNGIIASQSQEIIQKTYTIQSGDTLTKILKEQIPSIKGLGATHAQENAMANIFKSLTPDELTRIGLRPGADVNHIYAGDKIDTNELNKIIESKKSIIESARARFGDSPAWQHYKSEVPPVTDNVPSAVDNELPGGNVTDDVVSNINQATRVEDIVSNPGDTGSEADTMSNRSEIPVVEIDVTTKKAEFALTQFNKSFIEGKIPHTDWERLRRIPMASVDSSDKAIFGAGDPSEKRVGMFRKLFEGFLKVKPTDGETVEEYIKRGTKTASELGNVQRNQFEYLLNDYNKVDYSRDLIAERVAIRTQEMEEQQREIARKINIGYARNLPFIPGSGDPYVAGNNPFKNLRGKR